MANDTPGRVENANHDKVMFYIDKTLSETSRYCPCHRCRLDAAAMALNTLPPHYYVSAPNNNPRDLGSPWILIEVAVREAMDSVRLSPRHAPLSLLNPDEKIMLDETGTG